MIDAGMYLPREEAIRISPAAFAFADFDEVLEIERIGKHLAEEGKMELLSEIGGSNHGGHLVLIPARTPCITTLDGTQQEDRT